MNAVYRGADALKCKSILWEVHVMLMRKSRSQSMCERKRTGHSSLHSVVCLTLFHSLRNNMLKSNHQKAIGLKWDVTVKSDLLENKSINQIVLHLVFFDM